MKSILMTTLLAFMAGAAHADNYCDSPEWSVAYNKSYDEVLALAKGRDKKVADVECSVADQVLAVMEGEAGIERYPGRVLIADERDQRFKVVQRVGKYTIFSYAYNPRQLLQFAMKDLTWHEGEFLQAGPYKVIGVEEFKSFTGFPVKLMVMQLFPFYGPKK
ncbi:hypothetical protein [Pseudoduganella sp. OTU4001]|uniref:hypothetical protein n=1 Tax=Pseudoduganella sp. OTU4001 TaxID=3043854 RepID=UPI00313B2773